MFSFHYWFLLLLIAFVDFINFRVLTTVSSGVFISPLIFTIVFRVFSFRQLSLSWLFFVRYSVFILLYRECYGFERVFLLSGVFYLPLFPDIWHNLLLSRLPWEPAAGGSPTEVQNTDPAHLFVWIIQWSAKGILR